MRAMGKGHCRAVPPVLGTVYMGNVLLMTEKSASVSRRHQNPVCNRFFPRSYPLMLHCEFSAVFAGGEGEFAAEHLAEIISVTEAAGEGDFGDSAISWTIGGKMIPILVLIIWIVLTVKIIVYVAVSIF